MPDVTIPEPLVQIVAERILHGENSGHMPTTIARAALRAAAPHIAAQALRDAAQAWQINGWADALPHGSDRPSIIIGMAQRSADWLRDRANRIEADHG